MMKKIMVAIVGGSGGGSGSSFYLVNTLKYLFPGRKFVYRDDKRVLSTDEQNGVSCRFARY